MTQSSLSRARRAACPAVAESDAGSSRTLGPWQLVSQLHIGPAGSTYLARPAAAGDVPCQYVVKVLEGQQAHDPQRVDLMRREALVGRKVCHPHLVCVLDAQVQEPPYYLVMPWLDGETLRARLDRCHAIPPGRAFWLVRQIADALLALHRQGWMHADVKPENISVAPDGHATLLDLGFARRLDEVRWAAGRTVVGTLNYMAPEMITSAVRPDARSDLYSLGVTLYEALSGRLPLAGRTAEEVASQHCQSKPDCIRLLVPHLPKAAASLLHRMLAKHPLRRPQSAGEVVRRLVALEIDAFGEW